MNIHWIHFILFLFLVLGGHSGLLGQYADSTDEPLSIEPWSIAKDDARKAKREAGEKPRSLPDIYAKCYTYDTKTKKSTYLSSCRVYFFNGYVQYTGGHKHDNAESNSRLYGQNIPRRKEKTPTRPDSISLITSTKPLSLEYVPIGLDGDGIWALVGEYTDPVSPSPNAKLGFPYNLNPSQVGQEEWVAVCHGPPVVLPVWESLNCGSYNFDVKYRGLTNYRDTITSSPLMTDIGWRHTKHPDNHYGTSGLQTAITRTVSDYYNEFGCYETPPDRNHRGWQKVGINDMSLEYGGVFDIKYNWRGPHYSHHKGNAVDIRCKPDEDNSVIYFKNRPEKEQGIINRFLEMCESNGLPYAKFEYYRDPETGEMVNHHCHCGTSGDGEKKWRDPLTN